MKHIVSATTLTSGAQLAMCGHVFTSFDAAIAEGHRVGNYLQQRTSLSAYHADGVDCETCAVRHSHALGNPGIASKVHATPCPVDPLGTGVHSDDRVTVYHGHAAPAVVCGYHATFWPELVAQAKQS